jgi:3',5'-cyclic AMP phosphodiesterase CpdA
MPVSLAPTSRRHFLGSSAAALLAYATPKVRAADGARADPDRFALLSDVHIHADKATRTGDTVVWETLSQAVREIVALDPPPAATIVNGDCAHMRGRREDYATFVEGVAPLRRAGMGVHMTLGNHDSRENFLNAVTPGDVRANDTAVADRMVCVLPARWADLYLLDSLDRPNTLKGVLGRGQLDWLARALDARPDRPALVFVHHNPDGRPQDQRAGLVETEQLFEVLLPRKQVKALFYGHSHVWTYTRRQGMHLVNLPPTAWLFMPALPRGWVDLRLGEGGATMELRSLDADHHQHGERVRLDWR